MFKRFLRDSVIYGASSILASGSAIFLLPFYSQALSPTDYGLVDILRVFSSLIYVVVALEITQGLARHYPDAESTADQVEYASTSLWFTVTVYTAFVAIGFLLAGPLAALVLDSQERTDLFKVGLLSIWSYGLFYLAQQQLRWGLQAKAYAVSNLLSTLVQIGATIFLVLVVGWGAIGVVAGWFVGYLAGAAFSLFAGRHFYKWTFNWPKLKEMLLFSFPLVPSSIGVIVSLYIDRIAIKEFMNLAEVGIFGVGYRLASIASLLLVGFQGALMPLIYTHYREPETPAEIARIFRFFVTIALLLFLFMTFFAPELLILFTDPAYYSAASVLPLLVLAILFSGMYVFAPGLSIARKSGTVAIINVVSAVVNTALNVALIPFLGIRGAALATFLSGALIFTLNMLYSQRYYFVPHPWKQLALASLVTVLVVAAGTMLHPPLLPPIPVKLLLIAGTPLLYIWLGLVDVEDLKSLWGHIRRRTARPTMNQS